MNKRYLLTGSGLILILVVLVFSARYVLGTGTTASVAPDNSKVKGPQNAPVRLIVYSDFQCPACKNAVVPIEELRNQFSDSVQIEFRHYPLERPHKWALTAALFAQCAAEQDKFWPFHDRLYETQETWSASADPLPFFAGLVRETGLDAQEFEACVQDPETLKQVRKEYSMGSKQGVQSTPTIFINGQMLVGSIQLKEKGPEMIAGELKKNQKPAF